MTKLAIVLLAGSVIFNIFIFRIVLLVERNKSKEIYNLFGDIRTLEKENRLLKEKMGLSDVAINKEDIKEALQLAMLQVHSDNPEGDNDKFIKFKDLYDKLC